MDLQQSHLYLLFRCQLVIGIQLFSDILKEKIGIFQLKKNWHFPVETLFITANAQDSWHGAFSVLATVGMPP
jgi:hypothetical protein